MRIRHAVFRVETPVVDVMVGQYWHLFGWMEGYFPNTTEIQGIPGELYARAPQVRISKTIKAVRGHARDRDRGGAAAVAVGGARGRRRASGCSIDHWTGMHTAGATGTSLVPASIAVTGDVRYFEIPEAASVIPTSMVNSDGGIGRRRSDPAHPAGAARTSATTRSPLMGQAVYGNGISDLYAGMQSGVMFPFVPITPALAGVPAWPTNIDQGLVTYDINPGGFALHPIQWSSLLVGLEYYLPGLDGRVWISGNYLAHRVEQLVPVRARADRHAQPRRILLPGVDGRRCAGRGLVGREPLLRSPAQRARRARVRDVLRPLRGRLHRHELPRPGLRVLPLLERPVTP